MQKKATKDLYAGIYEITVFDVDQIGDVPLTLTIIKNETGYSSQLDMRGDAAESGDYTWEVEETKIEDEIISNDLDQIRELFDEIEKKTTFIDILENAGNAKGVQIFIGSQNFLFKHPGLSMVMAPYKNNEQEIIGAIGVVGPTRLNYSKIVPLVDYTSKIIGKVVK